MTGVEIHYTQPALSRGALRLRALRQFLSAATEAAGLPGTVAVLLTGEERVRGLNRQFRGKDRPTDVLSFAPGDAVGGRGHSGDLAISLDAALRQAGEYGHSLETEVRILMLHGLLHLAGHDHERDGGRMARLEERLRRQFGLPPGLVTRSRSGGKRSESKTASRKAEMRPSPSRNSVEGFSAAGPAAKRGRGRASGRADRPSGGRARPD